MLREGGDQMMQIDKPSVNQHAFATPSPEALGLSLLDALQCLGDAPAHASKSEHRRRAARPVPAAGLLGNHMTMIHRRHV